MERFLTVKQIQKLDRIAIDQMGISSLALMEIAGSRVVEVVRRVVSKKAKPLVVIVCGLGNNAGDGFVAARHLMNCDVRLKVVLIGQKKHLKTDALINYKAFRKCGGVVKVVLAVGRSFISLCKKADVIVDAIFGVGLNRNVENPFLSIIDCINNCGRYVVSVDVPSGLDGTTGEIYGSCIKANRTVTFSYAKKGFVRKQGVELVGRVTVVDIGIPYKLIRNIK